MGIRIADNMVAPTRAGIFLRVSAAVMIVLIYGVGHATPARSHCKNSITLVPLTPQAETTGPLSFVRFKYPLSSSDILIVRSHEDGAPTGAANDTGFIIMRNHSVLQRLSLKQISEIRREEPDYADNFVPLAVTRACGDEGPIFFLTMQYSGDRTSPTLFLVLVPSARGYEVTALPMISGGVLDVSRTNPLHLRTWDNLHEGQCEACETAYQLTEYEIRSGKPAQTRQYRTKHLYTSGYRIFDDRRRVRFVP
jgi:hypothetical protein